MTTEYAALIDQETWAFIEKTLSFYPPDAVDHTVAQQRDVYNTMCKAFFAGYPESVSSSDQFVQADGRQIPVRTYEKEATSPEAICLYFHGGGFVVGGLDSHDDVCAEICEYTGFRVVAVDYRLAPEHPHPASFEDCLAAFEHVAATSSLPIVLCGDSAGGNLVAAVSHNVRGHSRTPVGQVLIYPGLGGVQSQGSYITHRHAPMLSTRDTLYYAKSEAQPVTGQTIRDSSRWPIPILPIFPTPSSFPPNAIHCQMTGGIIATGFQQPAVRRSGTTSRALCMAICALATV